MGNITQYNNNSHQGGGYQKVIFFRISKKKLDLTKIKFAKLATNAILAFPKTSEVNPWDS